MPSHKEKLAMPINLPPPSPPPSDRCDASEVVLARCFCEKQLQGSTCFDQLPAHIIALIVEHCASVEEAAREAEAEEEEDEEERVADSPQLFERFSELPATVQIRIVQFCMPSGKFRYLARFNTADEHSDPTLLRCPPVAAQTSRLFYKYFRDQWKLISVGVGATKSKRTLSYFNFSTDKPIIDISCPLTSLNTAPYLVHHASGQRPGPLPPRVDETWAHAKAEAEIAPLPAAFFASLPRLQTYWLVIGDLGVAAAVAKHAGAAAAGAPGCRCVFSPMISCLSVSSITARRHAFRYHVATGRVACAEMSGGGGDAEELGGILAACGEARNPEYAARITFLRDGEDGLLDGTDGLEWWDLPAWGLLNFKYDKLKKRLDWGLVMDVLKQQVPN